MLRFSSLMLALGLFSLQAQAADAVVADWSERIRAQQPEQKLIEAYRAQRQAAEQSGGNLLGNSTLTLIHENDALTGNEGISNWEAGISLPLKALRQRQAYAPLAKAYDALARAQQAWLAWQARGIARGLLNDYQQAQVALTHAKARLAQAQRLFELVRQQVAAGARSQLDLALAQQQLGEAQAARLKAQAALNAQIQHLQAWGLQAPETLTSPKAVALSQLDALISRHPRMQFVKARQALKLAEAAKSAYDAQTSPELYLGARNEQATGVAANTRLVLEVSLPLGQSPDGQLARAQQRLTQREAQAAERALARDLKLTLISAQAQLKAAEANLAPAEARLKAAKQALRLSEQAWRQGEISLRELLLAQQAELDARLNLAQVQAARDAAVRKLNQAAGE